MNVPVGCWFLVPLSALRYTCVMAKEYKPNFKASHSAAHAVMAARTKSRGGADSRPAILPAVAKERGSQEPTGSKVRLPESEDGLSGVAPSPRDDDPLQGTLVRLRKSMWDQIDDVWHKQRLPSRTETVRALLAKALVK